MLTPGCRNAGAAMTVKDGMTAKTRRGQSGPMPASPMVRTASPRSSLGLAQGGEFLDEDLLDLAGIADVPNESAFGQHGWARAAWLSARAATLWPPNLQLRRVVEDDELLDELVLADALGLTCPSTAAVLRSPRIASAVRYAALRAHRAVHDAIANGDSSPFTQRAADRVARRVATLWLDAHARWPG